MTTQHADVLVIGGGHAGLCAAISAREAGAGVTLLEAAPPSMRAGNTRHTRNLRAMHNEPVQKLTGRYSEDEFWQDLLRVTSGNTNEGLARLMIRKSPELLSWLSDHGVRFQNALSGTLGLARTNAFFLGGGKALANSLYRTAEKLGVEIRYASKVSQLNTSNGDFESVTTSDNEIFSASAAILASGGFQANQSWMRQVWGSAADNFLIRGTPFATGEPLRASTEQGFETIGDATQCHAIAIDARGPKFDGGIVTRLDCVPFSIVVNQDGRRFYDEGEDFWPKRYAIWGRLIAKQPGQIAYAIIDAKAEDKFMPSFYPPFQASSIDKLARCIDLDPDTLGSTIAQYNRAVAPGHYDTTLLDDCNTTGLQPAKSHWALPIDTPPYSAYPLRPGITFTYLGLKVDPEARLQYRACPSANLFAAGEIMAGNILGEGYCAGTGMTIGGVFGRIAGEHAARLARQ